MKCWKCGGHRMVDITHKKAYGPFYTWIICPACHGQGRVGVPWLVVAAVALGCGVGWAALNPLFNLIAFTVKGWMK